ncbi:MAG: V-type ATP synthase subunit D [Eubacteriales bacterium]|nr:V-type ATP synthase subunit D [Eubacteriales bacterium]
MATTTNINATRMERLRQNDRLKTARRAHKLLEDKYDEMVHKFTELIKRNRNLRELVEKQLQQALRLYVSASVHMSTNAIDTALASRHHTVTLNCSSQNIMGLTVPHIEIADETLNKDEAILLTTPVNFDDAIRLLQQLTATLIELANIEKTCSMLADEIQKVRRRINSLEYNMIPDIQSKIKFITMKLDENQRETQIRVMKIKDMQSKAETDA